MVDIEMKKNVKMVEQKFYTKAQVIEASTKWFKGDVLPAESFAKKYALKRSDNEYVELTPDDMFDREAFALSAVEDDPKKWYPIFRKKIDGFKHVVPQGSPMAALGNIYQRMTCANCYVVPIKEDSLKSMFDALYEMAQIQAFRGGVGIDISVLRPDGSPVNNAAIASTGAWSWCDLFSTVTRMVGQSGRRGALMLTMDVSHPDIEKFVHMKSDLKKVTGANVSVKLTDKFMNAVRNNEKFDLVFNFKDTSYEPIVRTVNAVDIWNLIIQHATQYAEPGLLMWDTIIRRSPADCYADEGFATICTNPCGEVPLSAYDSCRLTSINLSGHVCYGGDGAYFDFDELKTSVAIAVRMLDNMVTIDAKFQPFSQQIEAGLRGRRLGLGIHGLGDALAKLGIVYGSPEAVKWVDKLMSLFKNTAYKASIELAKERGPFPIWNWEKEKNHEYLNELDPDVVSEMMTYGRRNIAILTSAPTGTVGLMSQTSSGLEPIFALWYERKTRIYHGDNTKADFVDANGDRWKKFKVFHHAFEEYLVKNNIDKNSITIDSVPLQWITADKLNWAQRVDMQAAITNHLDHSSSSTINLPKGTTDSIVGNIYMYAWEKGLKGVTVYVDGCRDGVLTRDDGSTTNHNRPADVDAVVHTVGANGHQHTVFIGLNKGEIYEIFCVEQKVSGLVDGIRGKIIRSGKNYDFVGGEVDEDGDYSIIVKKINKNENTEASTITRLVSMALQHGVAVEEISKQLIRAKGTITSMAKSINRVLAKYSKPINGIVCSECNGSNTRFEEGCMKCLDCGQSKCG